MSRIPERSMVWNGRGKRQQRDNVIQSNNLQGNVDQGKRYSFGNPEVFKEMLDIVSKFNGKQIELVESTGFGVFARLRISVRFDQAFSVWLMGRVDCTKQCITLPKGTSINMFPFDVNRVFGVPNNGIVPWHHSLDKSWKSLEKVQQSFGVKNQGDSCNAAAEAFLRGCVAGTVVWDDDSFRLAFVVYVMAVISDPKRQTHFETQNFLPALVKPDEICNYDWARCILEDVMSMCREAQADVKKKMQPCPSAGALLFLTVFYLDNMDYGSKTIKSSIVPRIQLFDADVVSELIKADGVGIRGGPTTCVFGTGTPRPQSAVVYRRMATKDCVPDGEHVNERHGVLGSNTAKVKDTNTPEIAGIAEVDVYTKLLVKAYKAKCLKHLTAARNAIEHETDDLVRQLYKSSISRLGGSLATKSEGGNQQDVHNQRKTEVSLSPPTLFSPESGSVNGSCVGFNFETPPFELIPDDRNCKTEVVMLDSPGNSPPKKTRKQRRIREPLSVLKDSTLNARRAIESFDLNVSSFVDFSSKKKTQPGVFAKPAWKTVDGPVRRNSFHAREFYLWALKDANNDMSKWVDHLVPKKIEVKGCDIIKQLQPGGTLEHNVIDAAVREMFQTESGWYGGRKRPVWRHFIETDFARCVLMGGDYLHDHWVREQFVGDHMFHDMSQSQMLLMIAEIEEKWAGLSWDFKRRQITCFAPGHVPTDDGEGWNAHTKALDRLHVAMETCIRTYFDGWEVNWDTWPKVLLRCDPILAADTKQTWCESGVLALQFLRTFDGVVHRAHISEVGAATTAREEILFSLMHLKGNVAVAPTKFSIIEKKIVV